MPEFIYLKSPEEALSILLQNFSCKLDSEIIWTVEALGRVTASPVTAPHPLPEFPRSTVDGYAVRAADTYGASEGLPAYFTLAGEVPMGAAPGLELRPGECALIHTGGMLPQGTDAVVMLEYTQVAREPAREGNRLSAPGEVEVLRAAAVGENVIELGEDVAAGQEVIPAGVRLRPAEIGGLMALGLPRVDVARRPRAALLSSGDEVVPPETRPRPGQVRDVNAYTLAALVQQAGGEPVLYGIVPDRPEALLAAARRALLESDLLVITAGSSASTRDLTAQAINELGKPGVLVHGVNVRPGKPTILGVVGDPPKPAIGLPGNPVSALVIAGLFVVPVIEKLLGLRSSRPRPSIRGKLSTNLPSQAGREDWAPVRLIQGEGETIADPVFGKSNLIFTLARADGLVRIPPDATGLSAGEWVEVFLL
jgi:molybdopterin molybdotransferase